MPPALAMGAELGVAKGMKAAATIATPRMQSSSWMRWWSGQRNLVADR
jgi:hypothetical protein